jgi:cell division septal protein FtsQ
MILRKKKPRRLYYPAKSTWYKRPRRRPKVKRARKLFKGGFKGFLKQLARRSLYALIAVIAVAILVLILTLSSYFAVTDIEVVRENFNIDSAAIENKLNPFIGRNFLFFPKKEVQKVIHEYFPEFAEIEVHKVFPSTIQIDLKSHPIVANLRAYYILPKAEELPQQSFTALSRAVEELSGDIGAISLEPAEVHDEEMLEEIFSLEEGDVGPLVNEQKSLINRIGQAIFDQEENLELMTITIRGLTQPVEDREHVILTEHMGYMLEAIKYWVNVMGIEIVGVEYLAIPREIHLKTTENLILWLTTERDFKKQIDKLSTIYEAAELSSEDLSYIDLRIRDKVIYCPRNSRCDK